MLKLHSFLDKASGIILGKYEQYDDLTTGRKPYDILPEQLEGRQIPIIADVDCSHTHPLHAMPLGLRVRIDATHKQIHFTEHWLS